MNRRHLTISSLTVALVAAGYVVGSAAGGPTIAAETLHYAGVLYDNGSPVNASQNIGVSIYANASGSGSPLCALGSAPVQVTQGHFKVALPAECVAVVKATPDTWVQATINGVAMGVSRLGAVPYAVEAEHAVNADTALSVDWTSVQNKPPLEVFSANGIDYSNHATFCDQTPDGDGDRGGYAGAKGECETACASSSAHVCTGAELLRWASTGGVMGKEGYYNGGLAGPNGATATMFNTDCFGWTDGTTGGAASYWSPAGHPSYTNCNSTKSLMCCN